MDPLRLTCSAVPIAQSTLSILDFLDDIREAPNGRASYAAELGDVIVLMKNLDNRLHSPNSGKQWSKTVEQLAECAGPLDQLKQAIELLGPRLKQGKGLKEIRNNLGWKFKQSEIESVLSRIHRVKSTIQIVLQNNHLFEIYYAKKMSC